MVSAFIVGLVVQHLGGKVGVALLMHSATLKLPKIDLKKHANCYLQEETWKMIFQV